MPSPASAQPKTTKKHDPHARRPCHDHNLYLNQSIMHVTNMNWRGSCLCSLTLILAASLGGEAARLDPGSFPLDWPPQPVKMDGNVGICPLGSVRHGLPIDELPGFRINSS